MAWDWRATVYTPGEESCLGSTLATALSELHCPSVGHTAPGQPRSLENCTFPNPAPPMAPTPECEGLPTAWSGCCGSRNTLAHCPVSSLGEKGEEALAGVLGTALPFPAHRKCQLPHSTSLGKGRINPTFLPRARAASAWQCQRAGGATAQPGQHRGCAQPHTPVAHTQPHLAVSLHTDPQVLSQPACIAPVHTCEHTHPPCAAHRHKTAPAHTPGTLHTPPASPALCVPHTSSSSMCTATPTCPALQSGTLCHLSATLVASASPSLHLTPGLLARTASIPRIPTPQGAELCLPTLPSWHWGWVPSPC